MMKRTNVPQAGVARYQGCPIPDTDKDGVNDEEDKCPTVPGVPENLGCPALEDVQKKVVLRHDTLFAQKLLWPSFHKGVKVL